MYINYNPANTCAHVPCFLQVKGDTKLDSIITLDWRMDPF